MIALLALAAVILGMTVLGVQFTRGRVFTLLTFHAALFVLEAGGGSIKAMFPGVFYEFSATTRDNPLPYVPLALAVYIGGFVLMLYGYCVAAYFTHRRASSDEAMNRFFDERWTFSYKTLLLLFTLGAIAAGFMPHYYKIRAVGLSTFLQTAYLHRFGTGTDVQAETAVVVVASVISSSAIPLALIWMFAWLRGRLTLMGKVIILGVFALLMFRQYTTMFRTIILATLLAMVAAYTSERRITIGKWVLIGSLMAAMFVAVNFFHFYLYYLTAGWDRQGLLRTMDQFLGPHFHVYTLSSILMTYERGAPLLEGKGLLESVFYFVPRGVWESKLPSTEYGTLLIQGWAELPTHFQMATTAVGEWIAHFGYIGMVLMFPYGLLVGWLDSFYDRGTVFRAALFGILLARVLAEAGMGVSALAITVTLLGVFFGIMFALDLTLASLRWLFGVTRRRSRVAALERAPRPL